MAPRRLVYPIRHLEVPVDLAEEEMVMAEEPLINQDKIQAYQILQTMENLVELV